MHEAIAMHRDVFGVTLRSDCSQFYLGDEELQLRALAFDNGRHIVKVWVRDEDRNTVMDHLKSAGSLLCRSVNPIVLHERDGMYMREALSLLGTPADDLGDTEVLAGYLTRVVSPWEEKKARPEDSGLAIGFQLQFESPSDSVRRLVSCTPLFFDDDAQFSHHEFKIKSCSCSAYGRKRLLSLA